MYAFVFLTIPLHFSVIIDADDGPANISSYFDDDSSNFVGADATSSGVPDFTGKHLTD